MFNNKLKQKLYNDETCFGTFMSLNSTDVVECAGLAGFDFAILDCEHGYITPENVMNLVRAAEVTGMTPITRATYNDETDILRVLDVGSHGVQVPQINCREDAELVVKRVKYSPLGTRGAALTRSSNYGLKPIFEYFEHANRETLVVVHIENTAGLRNIDEIAKVDGIDVLFLGPFDMSQSMGIPGQMESNEIQKAANIVLSTCKKYGKIPGIYAEYPEVAKKRASEGFKYIPYSMVTSLISRSFMSSLEVAKGRS